MNTDKPEAPSPNADDITTAEKDALFNFPCDFPIKIMGQNADTLRPHVEETTARLGVESVSLTERPSAKGNYLAITLTIRATSRGQLDELYRALGESADVKALL